MTTSTVKTRVPGLNGARLTLCASSGTFAVGGRKCPPLHGLGAPAAPKPERAVGPQADALRGLWGLYTYAFEGGDARSLASGDMPGFVASRRTLDMGTECAAMGSAPA